MTVIVSGINGELMDVGEYNGLNTLKIVDTNGNLHIFSNFKKVNKQDYYEIGDLLGYSDSLRHDILPII